MLLPGAALPVAARYHTIFGPVSAPPGLVTGPDEAKELGVKFKSDVAGAIRGVRFYKTSADSGRHSVRLWTVSGALLATAISSNESASGWQQADFSTPVAIKPDVVYVASYHADAGHYRFTPRYFAHSGVDNPPLHALASSASGGNGVYADGSGKGVTDRSLDGANFWVDVAFTPSEMSLVSISVKPANAGLAAGVATRFIATASYSDGSTRDLDDQQVIWESKDPGIATVNRFGIAMGVAGGETTITARVKSAVASASLAVSPGPGGSPEPLLVVTSAANPFTSYLPEILRAEGLNEFDVLDLSRVSSAVLSSYDLVLLGDMSLTPSQVAMIAEWVKQGGDLIAMHPDKQLAGLLGLADAGGTLSDAYVQMNTSTGPGVGLVADPIQYHGSADRYSLKGATSLATLHDSPSAPASGPAVTQNAIKRGKAAAFTYDLARSVVYTRQGNPAWSGQTRDKVTPIRTYELFLGKSSVDPKPDWVDFNNIAIPQADEQQRLLANLILQMAAARKPLPRFWYLPRGLKAAVVMTGDDHGSFYAAGNGNTAARFSDYLNASPPGCNTDDWECVRASAYLFPPSVATNPMSNVQAADAVARGFEIGIHVKEPQRPAQLGTTSPSSPDCTDWNATSLDGFYTVQLSSFFSHYTSVPLPQTARMHCVSWSDYDSQPQIELLHNIRLDTNYYYYPKTWVNDRPGLFTGSAMPMRFATRNGTVIDVYQAATQMTDESGQSYPFTSDVLLDNALGPRGYYGVFTANMHADTTDSTAALAIVASAQARGVPVVSALQMLKWLDGRNRSFFSALEWKDGVVSFAVSVAHGANGLQVLLPAQSASGRLAGISLNDNEVPFTTRVIKGIEYAAFAAGSGGAYRAWYRSTAATSTARPRARSGPSSHPGT